MAFGVAVTLFLFRSNGFHKFEFPSKGGYYGKDDWGLLSLGKRVVAQEVNDVADLFIIRLRINLTGIWKDMVNEWVNATDGSEVPLRESRNPYVLDEEEGLPSPPVDYLAFLNPYSMSLDLSKRRVQTHETIVAFRLLKELVALEKANKLDAERKKDVDVKVASASLLQKKQELAVTQTEADMSPENQAKKAFAMSKGMFTYPSLAARSLVRDIGFGPVSVLSW
ncbi:hypothetical protein Tco_0435001 [Tanacetum coccineum]